MSDGAYSKKPVKVLIARGKTPDRLKFHIKARISMSRIAVFDMPLGSDDWSDLTDAGDVGSKIVEHLDTVDGITSIFLLPHELSIMKSPVYDWIEIIPDIYKAIQGAVNRKLEVQNIEAVLNR
jgi:hypothetical protein